MKDFLLLDEMLDKQKIHLNKAYEEGYKAGYKDGFNKGYAEVKTALDKIKSEIASCRGKYFKNDDGTISPYMNGTMNSVLQIINKYIG